MGGEKLGISSMGLFLCWFISLAVAASLHADSSCWTAPPRSCPSQGSGNNLPCSVPLALGGKGFPCCGLVSTRLNIPLVP